MSRCLALLAALALGCAPPPPEDSMTPSGPPGPPPSPSHEPPPPALVRYVEAQGGDPSGLTREPHHDHGDFACYLGDVRGLPPRVGVAGRLFVSDAGVVAPDGTGPWATFLGAAEAAATAKTLERLFADRMAQLHTPADPKPSRVDDAEWALVSDPSLTEAEDALVFTAWYGSPPAFEPARLTVTAPPSGPATFAWAPAHTLTR